MPLRIQARQWKNADATVTQTWRLIIEDASSGERVSRYPAKTDYAQYGLNPADPLEVAKEKARIMNRAAEIRRRSVSQAKIQKRISTELEKESRYLPASIYSRFLKFLAGRRAWDGAPPPKMNSWLLSMRKVILEVDIDPAEWPKQPGVIYRWFIKRGLSFSSFQKVLPLLNDYGYFYCSEFQKPFLPIPYPTGLIIERLNDANYDKRDGRTNESQPLTPEHLTKLQHWKPEQRRWMAISLYFGLRPDEVDAMTLVTSGKRWRVETDDHGTTILVVYQPKLVRVPRERRWKRIPCLTATQKKLLQEIRDGAPIKRPYARYLQGVLGPGFTLYAGRKGFEDLMRTLGQDDINVYRWLGKRDFPEFDHAMRDREESSGRARAKAVSKMLGHAKIRTTQKHYTNPKAVDYDPPKRRTRK